MKIKITTLSENSAKAGGFLAEWGISMHVEVGGLRVLFDTGGGISAARNAAKLGVDLAAIDCIVLSHGHYDHTGGLREVLKSSGPKRIIAHPDIWAGKYDSFLEGLQHRYIGIPFTREELEGLGASFELSREPVRISETVMTTGEIPMTTDYEAVEEYLLVGEGEAKQPDALADDLALIIDADFGLVVLLGCAHRGIVNTLRRARALTGRETVYAVIGGTHLLHASPERLVKTAADLREMGVQYVGVSHCTGFNASAFLAQEFGSSFFLNNAGTQLTLPF